MTAIVKYIVSLGISEAEVDSVLLLQSLTHKSFSADTPDAHIPHNERLEFL
jgi:dsRNA-specific ribonuclease